MNAGSQRLTGAARCDRLGWVKRERKGAVHASGFKPFLSVRIVKCMGGTSGHHHLRSPKNVSKRWGSPHRDISALVKHLNSGVRLTQDRLAQELGVSFVVNLWENGRRTLRTCSRSGKNWRRSWTPIGIMAIENEHRG